MYNTEIDLGLGLGFGLGLHYVQLKNPLIIIITYNRNFYICHLLDH